MPWQAKERTGTVEILDGHRFVRIPDEFVLAGMEIVVRQEKDGVITIHPATDEGRKALDNFTPFGD